MAAKPTPKAPAQATRASDAEATMVLPPLNINEVHVYLIGEAPLICHAWSHKAKQEMLSKQLKDATGAKKAKDPIQDFQDSLYRLSEGGGYGFPSVAFKTAAVTACTSIAGMTKVAARQAFHIFGEQIETESVFRVNGAPLRARSDLVRILAGPPEMREDMVRVGMGVADIRYRGQFFPWACMLNVRYNRGVLSEHQIFNLLNTAGFGVGVGEWRPEKDGLSGLFRVAGQQDMPTIENLRKASETAERDLNRMLKKLAA